MISSSRAQKLGGAGTTRKIREQLGFTDERRWKVFSGRRLALIEKFGLGERKASEQDKNIRQIATILRTEFGYPLSSSGEFEKLVTAAVQSVRRNRKRSSRTKASGSSPQDRPKEALERGNEFIENDKADLTQSNLLLSKPDSLPSPAAISDSSQATTTQPPTLFTHLSQTSNTSRSGSFSNSTHTTLPALQPKPQAAISRTGKDSPLPSIVATHAQNYDEIIKAVIADAVHNRVSLHEQSRKDDATPNLTDFALSSNDGNLLNLAFNSQVNTANTYTIAYPKAKASNDDSNSGNKIPFFLREKILLHVQRSRACLEVSSAQGSLDLYANLFMLGEVSIKASVAFVMERFFSNLTASSVEYVTSKLCSERELALVAIKLFGPATEHNLEQISQGAQLKLFYLIIGGIVKDFGFDPSIYPLSEIMHDVILRQYPLDCYPKGDYRRAAVMSTVSMVPATANKDVYRIVLLKFKDKEQRFTFHLLSNGSPTIAEILANSRNLFQIVSQAKSLNLVHNNRVIKDDLELASIFNRFTSEEIIIEVREIKPEAYDGLAILSSVSASALPSLTPGRASQSTYGSTISTPSAPLPVSSKAGPFSDTTSGSQSSLSGKHCAGNTESDTNKESDLQSKETEPKLQQRFQPLL